MEKMKISNEIRDAVCSKQDSYSKRRADLEQIVDPKDLEFISRHAEDDWIRLEAASLAGNTQVLQSLTHHTDERIRLDAAIELSDEEVLAQIAIGTETHLHADIALNHINNMELLHRILRESGDEWVRVEAGLRACNLHGLSALSEKLEDESMLLRLAIILDDPELLERLAHGAKDKQVAFKAAEWLMSSEEEGDFD